jgi:hypothetical protein
MVVDTVLMKFIPMLRGHPGGKAPPLPAVYVAAEAATHKPNGRFPSQQSRSMALFFNQQNRGAGFFPSL